MRKYVGAALVMVAFGFGGFTAAFADPDGTPACDGPGAAVHNKHCNGGNPGGKDARDADGNEGDAPSAVPTVGDVDNDGHPDGADNCPLTYNPSQRNDNGDGDGNACESDTDGDHIPDGLDNCRTTANTDQADADHDGRGDPCDPDDGDNDRDGNKVPDQVDNAASDAQEQAKAGAGAALDSAEAAVKTVRGVPGI